MLIAKIALCDWFRGSTEKVLISESWGHRSLMGEMISELDLEEIVISSREQIGKDSWERGNNMYKNMEEWNSIVCLGKHEWFIIAGG